MNALVRWNAAAAGLHAAFAVWAYRSLASKRVTLFKQEFDTTTSPASDIDYPVKLDADGSVDVKPLVVAFFAITSLAHVGYATDFAGRGWYSSAVLKFGWNPFRWFEYSVTAGIMLYLIAVLAGSKERVSALTVALITPGLMLQGYTTERALHQNVLVKNREHPDGATVWANFGPAWLLFGVKWYIIISAFQGLKRDIKNNGGAVDPRLELLVWSQLALFSAFGVVQTAQVVGWRSVQGFGARFRVPYVHYEKAYIALSLVAKAALGLSVANLLRA